MKLKKYILLSLFALTINNSFATVKFDGRSFLIDGVLLLQDAEDNLAYYYAPKYPTLALKQDSSAEFLFMKYIGEDQESSGALFHALIEFTITDGELKVILKKLQKKIPNARIKGRLSFLPSNGSSGDYSGPTFQVVSSVLSNTGDGGLTRSVLASGNAPMTPGSKAAIAANLDSRGSSLFGASLKSGETSDISIGLKAYYEAILPSYNAVITVDMEKIYSEFLDESNEKTFFSQKDIKKTLDSIANKGGIKIDISDRSQAMDIDNAAMASLVDMISAKITDTMFGAAQGDIKPPEDGMGDDSMAGGDMGIGMGGMDPMMMMMMMGGMGGMGTGANINASNTDDNDVKKKSAQTDVNDKKKTAQTDVNDKKKATQSGVDDKNKAATNKPNPNPTRSRSNAVTSKTPDNAAPNKKSPETVNKNAAPNKAKPNKSIENQKKPTSIKANDPANKTKANLANTKTPTKSSPITGGSGAMMGVMMANMMIDKALKENNSLYTLKNKKEVKLTKYQINLSKAASIKVPFYTSGNLSLFFQNNKEDERYFKSVNLDDASFQRREITFQVDNEYADAFGEILNFVTINFRKKYTNGQPEFTSSLQFSKEDIAAGTNIKYINYKRLGLTGKEWQEYEYQIIWNLKGKSLNIRVPENETEWIKSSKAVNTIAPPFKRQEIDVDAERDRFVNEGFSSANIRFATVIGGKPTHVKRLLLKASDSEWSSKVCIYHDSKQPVVYETTWYSPKGEVKQELQQMDSNYLFVVPPSQPKN